ncbi:hypothetical protein MP228_002088 [Amoeboaphelidium protococcarum]|nr:hypothetical protein MP228_002088 [Amoeboaphelidium protococcarum]
MNLRDKFACDKVGSTYMDNSKTPSFVPHIGARGSSQDSVSTGNISPPASISTGSDQSSNYSKKSFDIVSCGTSSKLKMLPIAKPMLFNVENGKHTMLTQAEFHSIDRERRVLQSKMSELQVSLKIEKRVKDAAHSMLQLYSEKDLKQLKRLFQEILQLFKREIELLRLLCAYSLRSTELADIELGHNNAAWQMYASSRDHGQTYFRSKSCEQVRKDFDSQTLKSQLKNYKSELKTVQSELAQLKCKNEVLTGEQNALLKLNQDQESLITQLQSSLNLLTMQLHTLQSYSVDDTSQPDPPPRSLLPSDYASDDFDSMLQKYDESTDTIAKDLVFTLQQLNQLLGIDCESIDQFVQSVNELKGIGEQNYQRLSELSVVVQSLQQKVSSKSKECELVANERDEAVMELELLKQRHQAQIKDLYQSQSEKVEEYESVQVKQEELISQQQLEMDKLQLQNQQLMAEVQTLKNQQPDNQELKSQYSQLQDKYDSLRAQSNQLVQLLDDEKDARQVEVEYLTKQLNDVKSCNHHQVMQEKDKVIAALENDCQMLIQEVERTTSEWADFKEKKIEFAETIEKYERQIYELQSTIIDKQKTIENLQG